MGLFDEVYVHYVCECGFYGKVYTQTKKFYPSMMEIFIGTRVLANDGIYEDTLTCPQCEKEAKYYMTVANSHVVYIGKNPEIATAMYTAGRHESAYIPAILELNMRLSDAKGKLQEVRRFVSGCKFLLERGDSPNGIARIFAGDLTKEDLTVEKVIECIWNVLNDKDEGDSYADE